MSVYFAEDPGNTLIEQFNMSPIGKVISETKIDYNLILDPYVNDFVHMSHPCFNNTEHKVMSWMRFHNLAQN